MSKEPEGYVSYTNDALADLKTEQEHRRKVELAEQKRLDAKLNSTLEFRRKIFDAVIGFLQGALVALIVIGVLAGSIFGIYKAAKSHYAKEQRINVAWNSSCAGANGTLVFGDTDTDQDNRCVFSNGLTEYQYRTDNNGSKYSQTITDHNQWVDLCIGAKGLPTPVDQYDFSYCVFPNGFSVSNYEKD